MRAKRSLLSKAHSAPLQVPVTGAQTLTLRDEAGPDDHHCVGMSHMRRNPAHGLPDGNKTSLLERQIRFEAPPSANSLGRRIVKGEFERNRGDATPVLSGNFTL